MKKLSKHQSRLHKNSDLCVVTEYDMGDPELDFAIAKISGRYPAERYVTNTKCKEIAYIQEGAGKIEVNGVEHPLTAGDLVLIEAGEKFYWEGHMTLFMSCHPAFTIDQHQLVD